MSARKSAPDWMPRCVSETPTGLRYASGKLEVRLEYECGCRQRTQAMDSASFVGTRATIIHGLGCLGVEVRS